MKRNLLLLTSLFFTIFATGQSPLKKSGIAVNEKFKSFDNYQDFLSKGERLDSLKFESWDKTIPGWLNTTKVTSVYGTNSQIDITYSWDKTSIPNKWVRISKSESNFDVSGNLTSRINYAWDKNIIPNSWALTSKTENTYVNGNNTLSISYIWDGSQWIQSGKTETTFNQNHKPTIEITSAWFFIQWLNAGKTEYYYDVSGKDTLEINYSWVTNNWANSEKTRFAYNTNGKVITETTLEWDETLTVPAWINSGKTEYTYDSNWNVTSMSSYEWDKTPKLWVGLVKMEWGFTGDEITSIITYLWDKAINPATGWVNYAKTEKSGSGTLPNNVRFTEMKSYLWELNQWSITKRDTYYYSGQATSVNDNPWQKEVIVYPNPANDFIIFNLSDMSEPAFVELYDVQGRKVTEHKLSGNNRIPVSNLKKGIYIYKATSKGFVYKGKILIE